MLKKTAPTFEVKNVRNENILNFKDWWPHFFKKTSKDLERKVNKFSISQYRHLIYDSDIKGCIKASHNTLMESKVLHLN